MPRIKQLADKADLPAEQHAEYDHIVDVLHRVGGPFAFLLHSPGLAQKVMEAGAQIRLGSTLESWQRELCIIAVTREKDAGYEWASHVATGRKAGLREEAIEAVRHRQPVDGLLPDERGIILFVRQLLRKNRVEQALFDDLLSRHTARWLVELAATVGQYQYISAITNTFELQASPEADQLPI
ncbi:MAG: carboxymuconolactone decarboxylase family protein [Chloroflexota bacterium]